MLLHVRRQGQDLKEADTGRQTCNKPNRQKERHTGPQRDMGGNNHTDLTIEQDKEANQSPNF